ncbi:MAG: D-cysteine desulfhydrase family protein [Peptococcaceae bacterium]|nr:D-cysteine desulfhydrase family protein [Peptococcaceae bacterium]
MLEHLPRVKLAHTPTALEKLPRLGELLGIDLYIKRDDSTGLAMGGNKARKLEYLLADALTKGADTLLTTGGPQSNHCRMTAAAAAKYGLECHLAFSGRPIDVRQGNLYLDVLLGAKLHFVGVDDPVLVAAKMEELASTLHAQGRKTYTIPLGGSNPIGAVGYIRGIAEIITQGQEEGVTFDYIVHASGSAGTQAGLIAGIKAYGLACRVIGISVSRAKERLAREIYELCVGTLARAAVAEQVTPEDIVVYDEYVGEGYGLPTPASSAALGTFAVLEGVIMDPVYTAKAGAGLLDLAKKGVIPKGARVLFWHTGGTPALFADQALHWRSK